MKLKRKIKYLIYLSAFLIVGLTGTIFSSGGNDNWPVPAFVNKIKNPIPVTKLTIKEGEKLYTTNCQTCHGDNGIGDGPGGKYLGKKVADLTSINVQEQSDGALYYKISTGRTPMPAFKTILKGNDRWAVINYIRTLKSK